MKIIIFLTIFAVILLFSCSENSPNPNYDNDIDSINQLEIKEAIALANQWRESKPKITSYVTPLELVVIFPDKRQIKKPLPVDKMYIAIAPYINTTHPCETHYISSCKAELTQKLFMLTAKDEAGNIFYDESIISLNNGFFELWLPRNLKINLHVEYNALSCDELITTNANSNTCITTAKLK